jgi:hypothetical protein
MVAFGSCVTSIVGPNGGAHPHREVLPLGIGRRDVLGIGIAFDQMFHRADALRWAVAALAFRPRSEDLHEHCVINVRAEYPLDSF